METHPNSMPLPLLVTFTYSYVLFRLDRLCYLNFFFFFASFFFLLIGSKIEKVLQIS
jgi:uncharacterized membrane protein